MQNIPLLKALGRSRMPVMLKRGFGCTIDEWIHAAEYVLAEGNQDVVLCERGIRTLRDRDALHPRRGRGADREGAAGPAGGRRPVARRGQARLGREPDARRRRVRRRRAARSRRTRSRPKALSDGPQAVVLAEFPALMEKARRVAFALGRTVPSGARLAAAAGLLRPAALRAGAPASPAVEPSPRPPAPSPRA